MTGTFLKRLFLALAIALTLTAAGFATAGAWSTQAIDTRIDRTSTSSDNYGYCWFRDPKTGEIIYFPCRPPIEDPATY